MPLLSYCADITDQEQIWALFNPAKEIDHMTVRKVACNRNRKSWMFIFKVTVNIALALLILNTVEHKTLASYQNPEISEDWDGYLSVPTTPTTSGAGIVWRLTHSEKMSVDYETGSTGNNVIKFTQGSGAILNQQQVGTQLASAPYQTYEVKIKLPATKPTESSGIYLFRTAGDWGMSDPDGDVGVSINNNYNVFDGGAAKKLDGTSFQMTGDQWYTVRRVMDFSTNPNRSTTYIYDANGDLKATASKTSAGSLVLHAFSGRNCYANSVGILMGWGFTNSTVLMDDLKYYTVSAPVNPSINEAWDGYTTVPIAPISSGTGTVWSLTHPEKMSVYYEIGAAGNKVIKFTDGSGSILNQQQVGRILALAPVQMYTVKIKLPATKPTASSGINLFRTSSNWGPSDNTYGNVGLTINQNYNIIDGSTAMTPDGSSFQMTGDQWYTIKRVMDYSSVPNKASTYIYDANGDLKAFASNTNAGSLVAHDFVGRSCYANCVSILMAWGFSNTTVLMDDITYEAVNPHYMAYRWPVPDDDYGHSNIKVMVPIQLYQTQNPDQYAPGIKAQLDALPVSDRVIFIHYGFLNSAMISHRTNYVWLDGSPTTGGPTYIAAQLSAMFSKLSELGAKVDYVVSDYEHSLECWSGSPDMADLTANEWDQITTDTRYSQSGGLKDQLTSKGFQFDPTKPDLYYVYNRPGPAPYNNDYWYWNEVMGEWMRENVRTAIYVPVKTYYPNAIYSNYGYRYKHAANQIPDTNGNRWYVTNHDPSGSPTDASAFPAYGTLGQITIAGKAPAGYTLSSTYAKTGFNGLQYDQYVLRDSFIEQKDMMPWVANKDYTASTATFTNNDYYAENIYHTSLMAPGKFLYWFQTTNLSAQDQILSDILSEVDEVTQGTGERSLVKSTDLNTAMWNKRYILTGMEVIRADGGYNLWRITPDDNYIASLSAFQTSSIPPIFTINGKTITFPSGSTILTSGTDYTSHSNSGLWLKSPLGTYPTEQ